MAITKIGANLLTQGDGGTFESDVSTWNISKYSHLTILRNSLFHTGARSAQFWTNQVDPSFFLNNFARLARFGPFNVTSGKKYIFEGYVMVSDQIVLGDDTLKILFQSQNTNVQIYNDIDNTISHGDVVGVWKKIEYQFECIASGSIYIYFAYTNHADFGASGDVNNTGIIFLDTASLFEFIDGTEEDPVQDPPESVFFSRNPIFYTVNANPDNIDEPNYALHADVRIEEPRGTGNYVSKLKMELEPDSLGEARFQINEALRGALSAHVPDENETELQRVFNVYCRMKVFFGEKFGEDPELQQLTESSEMMAIMGGIQKEYFPDIDFFNSFLNAKKQYLTWQNKVKRVQRKQEEYLYFYVYKEIFDLRVWVRVYYDDEEQSELWDQHFIEKSDVKEGEIYCIPIGFIHGGIQALDPSKPVRKYDVGVWDTDGDTIGHTRTYILDETPSPYTRYFLFQNSLGGMDTLRTTGKSMKDFQGEIDIYEQILPENYSLQTAQFRKSYASFINETEVSSGHITKQAADYLQELLLSKEVYEITDGIRVPVIIDTDSFRIYSDGDYRYHLRFNYRTAYRNEVYTPANYNDL